jgi:hypothetical protein
MSGRGNPSAWSLRPPTGWWLRTSEGYRDYVFDGTCFMSQTTTRGDFIQTASVAVKPSGRCEMTASGLWVSGTQIGFRLADGVHGRDYFIEIQAQTAMGRSGRWRIELDFAPLFARRPVPPPQINNFGPPVLWISPNVPITDSDGNVMTDSNGNILFTTVTGTSPVSPVIDGNGNVLTDSNDNILFTVGMT